MAKKGKRGTCYETVITTRRFRDGQKAAQDVGKTLCTPNWKLIAAQDSEFRAGFRYEWHEYVLPMMEA